MRRETTHPELTILMPCLNEAEAIAACVKKASRYLSKSNIRGEILVADNGSTDGSREIAQGLGARVVSVCERGYGAALIGGIEAAKGRFVIMGDADDSYDFSQFDGFVAKLREGYDLVMGNRFKGGIEPGAMPALHRWLGNPLLSFIGRIFFKAELGDFHCGLRGFNTSAVRNLKPPHLRTWRDGWRHLRFLLIFSRRAGCFFIQDLALFTLGIVFSIALLPGPVLSPRTLPLKFTPSANSGRSSWQGGPNAHLIRSIF
jgi:glycosyltransferase involved in cell wall biosynthesis